MTLAGKPRLIRKINRQLLIENLREKQFLTSTELIKITGLSRRTINLIITSLKESGIVSEAGYGNSTDEGGKKPVIYKFNPNSFYTIGVIVRDLKIGIGICNLNGEILFEDSVIIDWQKGYKGIVSQIVKLARGIIGKSKIKFSKFLGMGIGLPGLINFKDGSVKLLTRHQGWENVCLVKILEEELGIHIEIENENYVRALGEKWFGIAKNKQSFITIMTTNEGIGCGVVVNNELIRSHNSLLGEIGHIKISNETSAFKDLKDFEYFLGLKHINELISSNMQLESFSKSTLSQIYNLKSQVTMEDLFSGYNSGEEFANFIVEKVSNYLTLLINIILCTYDPELIIIHGKYTLLDDKYFDQITGYIKESVFSNLKKKITIKKSLQTRKMAILGAAGMVLDEVSI